MTTMASQITSLTIVYSTVYSGGDQRKHESSASLAFVRGIHRWPVNSPHKGPVTRKMFSFDDVIMTEVLDIQQQQCSLHKIGAVLFKCLSIYISDVIQNSWWSRARIVRALFKVRKLLTNTSVNGAVLSWWGWTCRNFHDIDIWPLGNISHFQKQHVFPLTRPSCMCTELQ